MNHVLETASSPDFFSSLLKQSDAHFAKLFDSYHEINRSVHRAETNVEPMDGLAETELRKKRGALKDEIWGYLQK